MEPRGTSSMREFLDPRSAAGRLEFVDSLRGFALFGVFWANLLIFSGIEYLTEEQRASLFRGRLGYHRLFLRAVLHREQVHGSFLVSFRHQLLAVLEPGGRRAASATRLSLSKDLLAVRHRGDPWLAPVVLRHSAFLRSLGRNASALRTDCAQAPATRRDDHRVLLPALVAAANAG